MSLRALFAILLTFTAGPAPAQLSPPAQTTATIGGKKLTIAYSAPSMRGRKIFGGLVPYGAVWRAGADNATTFSTEADLDIGGLKTPKGIYTIYVLPSPNEWQLIINRQTGQWGTEYHKQRDLGRVKMNLRSTPAPVERFKIELLSTGGKQGLLKMTWERTEASVPIAVM
jgi:hypothetical protein